MLCFHRFGAQNPFNAFPQATIYQTTTMSMMMLNGSANGPPYGMNPNMMNPMMNQMNPVMGSVGNQVNMGNMMPNMDWNQLNMNQINPNQVMSSNPTYYNGGGSSNNMGNNDQFSQMNGGVGGTSLNPGMMQLNYSQGNQQPFDITNLFDNPMIYNNFKLFDSATYNGRDLLFLDQTVTFMDLDDKTSYLTFLSKFRKFL